MDNVVSIFSRNRSQSSSTASLRQDGGPATANEKTVQKKINTCNSFEEAALRNAEIQARLKKEREQANKGVLKNYKIK